MISQRERVEDMDREKLFSAFTNDGHEYSLYTDGSTEGFGGGEVSIFDHWQFLDKQELERLKLAHSRIKSSSINAALDAIP